MASQGHDGGGSVGRGGGAESTRSRIGLRLSGRECQREWRWGWVQDRSREMPSLSFSLSLSLSLSLTHTKEPTSHTQRCGRGKRKPRRTNILRVETQTWRRSDQAGAVEDDVDETTVVQPWSH